MAVGGTSAPRGLESIAPRAPATWDSKRQRLVQAKQIKTLYRHSVPVLLTNLGNALAVDVVLWSRSSRTFLVVWTGAMLLMTVLRIDLRRRYWKAGPPVADVERWERHFLVGTAAAGILWGTAGWVLCSPDDPVPQFLVAFVIAGMVAGAAGSLACHLPAFFLYLFPATVPLFVRWVLLGDSLHYGMAAMLVVFTGAFSLIAYNVNASITESFFLRFENLELLDRFRTAIDGSEDIFLILDSKRSEEGHIVDFTVVDLNSKAETTLVRDESDPLGRSMIELLPDFISSHRLDVYASVVATGGSAEREFHATTGPLARRYVVEQIVALSDGVAVTCRDFTRRRESELRLKDALAAKESLLKEVHHRVKNNLQLLLSMLNLQADLVTDERMLDIIRDIQDRLRSIATVHQRLSQSLDTGRIDLQQYIRALVQDLFKSHQSKSASLRPTIEVPQVELPSNDVMLCGLVVNELVTNAIKHGFPDARAGEVRVIGRDLGEGKLSIAVADNGIGFPESKDFTASTTLGLQLVHVLAKQLGGEVSLTREKGTTVELTFDATE